jgi:hypothetical protein
MKVLALLLVAFIGESQPIELWPTPLPDTLMRIHLTKGPSFNAPTPFYFKNLKFGCKMVAKDLSGMLACQRSVGEIEGLSTLLLGEMFRADALRNWGMQPDAKAAFKTADRSAARAEKLHNALFAKYPALSAFGHLPKRIEA